jgi:uncharacterized protein (TIGR03032 family)
MAINMSDTPLNEWNKADLKRSGFDAEGKRTAQVLQEAGKPELLPSPGFAKWLTEIGGSLAFSTYQTGRFFFLGIADNGSLYAQDRAVGTAMGLVINADQLWIACRDQIWRFANTGAEQIDGQNYDAVYMPRTGYMIGQSNTHDALADVHFQGHDYEFLYANTQFSCIAALDSHFNFRPVWKPEFITELKPEDRCHLNGICAQYGELAYASICGRYDTPLGWKTQQTGGAFVMDVRTGEIVCNGLSMPHSPRWHNGRLWILNSGEGEFGFIDLETKTFNPIAQCAGFARGLAFAGDYAIVGLSRLRVLAEGILSNINLARRLEDRHTFQRCGLQVFNLKTGELVHWLHINGVVTELYDIVYLSNITHPYTSGFSQPKPPLNRTTFPTN